MARSTSTTPASRRRAGLALGDVGGQGGGGGTRTEPEAPGAGESTSREMHHGWMRCKLPGCTCGVRRVPFNRRTQAASRLAARQGKARKGGPHCEEERASWCWPQWVEAAESGKPTAWRQSTVFAWSVVVAARPVSESRAQSGRGGPPVGGRLLGFISARVRGRLSPAMLDAERPQGHEEKADNAAEHLS